MVGGKMIKFNPKKKETATKEYVKKVIDNRMEDKQLGTNLINQLSDNVAQFFLLNGISQGGDQGQRVGDRIRMKHLDLRYSATQAGTGTGSQCIRVIIFVDRQPNGAAPSATQLFLDTTAGEEYVSPFNINGSKRYKILYDKFHDIQRVGGATDTRSVVSKNKQKIKINMPVVYNGTTSGIASINTNALYCAIVGDQASGANASVSFDAVPSLIFEDA